MDERGPYQSFAEFWPLYVRQHTLRTNRRLHFIGLLLAFAAIAAAIVFGGWLLLLAPVAGYGFAWYGHFFIEHNRPATFTYPLWSLRGDFRMFRLMLTGRMDAEVERYHGGDAG